MLSGDEHQHMINYSSKYIDEIFRYVNNSEKIIAKPNQQNELTVSHLHSYISWRGYINGLGSMSAEERMAASTKGYENGLGAMSAEARMVVGEKSMLAQGITWERMYAEFESYDGMPKRGTPLNNWQKNQLSNTHVSCLNAKILKEKKENKGSAIRSEWRVKLDNCVEQKNSMKMGNAWERMYAEFKSYDGMPKKGIPLKNWQKNQLKNGHATVGYAA